jgi:DNA-binding HxlR family transcriptional regulator
LFDGDVAWMLTWTTQLPDPTEDKALENVWRASVCRSLARLEKRGLVIRIKGSKKTRTVRVKFTDAGRKVAEALRD